MNALLMTPWQTRCGISAYGEFLVEAVHAADPTIQIRPVPEPTPEDLAWADLLVFNHSQGTGAGLQPQLVLSLAHQQRIPIVIIQHDTFETFAIMQERGFPDFTFADALIVHEEVEGLSGCPNVYTWRQGVPAPAPADPQYVFEGDEIPRVLGSAGFPFPWKNYDLLAEATGRAGWRLLLCAAGATAEQIAGWSAKNPRLHVETDYLPTARIVSLLSGCDATAFLYGTSGSGTSGAVRLGIAARKPLFITATRQFRDLADIPGPQVIPGTVGGLVHALQTLEPCLEDPAVARLAEIDAWARIGEEHASLYTTLLATRRRR